MCQCCLLRVQVSIPGGATGTTAVREQLAAVKKEFAGKVPASCLRALKTFNGIPLLYVQFLVFSIIAFSSVFRHMWSAVGFCPSCHLAGPILGYFYPKAKAFPEGMVKGSCFLGLWGSGDGVLFAVRYIPRVSN